jgi:three-Cys-motif partner protein
VPRQKKLADSNDETLWQRGAHTEGKHLVLRKYLNGWLPILGSWNGRILFVDGFAGPGEYADGEDGSPILALKALIEHAHRRVIAANVVFLFIEAEEDRAAHLEKLVNRLRPSLHETAQVEVINNRFGESMTAVLDELDEQQKEMAPAFVMVDPFGVSGTPMKVMGRILRNPRSELYISFMYESINRFLSTEEFAPHLDELFGTDEWREGLRLSGEARKRFLYALYARRLKESGAEHVVHFDLYQGSRLIYAIFFATQHEKGCDLMKQAIWKVAPGGDFAFRGTKDDQLVLGVDNPDFSPLMDALIGEFGEEEWTKIEEVCAFVASDRVEYHTGHLKKQVLKPMEKARRLEVDEDTRERRGTYPDGCRLRFRS